VVRRPASKIAGNSRLPFCCGKCDQVDHESDCKGQQLLASATALREPFSACDSADPFSTSHPSSQIEKAKKGPELRHVNAAKVLDLAEFSVFPRSIRSHEKNRESFSVRQGGSTIEFREL